MFASLDISTSGLVAQRTRMDVIAANVANAQSTERLDGVAGPYRRREAIFSVGDGEGGAGVHVSQVAEDPSPFRVNYEPGHPHADEKGYVAYPNVDLPTEMVNAMVAARAYEANITTMQVTKQMLTNALRLIA